MQLSSALEGPGVTKPGKQIKIHHLSNALFFEGHAICIYTTVEHGDSKLSCHRPLVSLLFPLY